MLLAIDTSSFTYAFALFKGQDCVAQITHETSLTHSMAATLIPELQIFLTSNGTTLADITALAVNRGPGSFTGLRVGLATTQALSFALKIPVLGVTTFQAMASTQAADTRAYPVVYLRDTKCQSFYSARFEAADAEPTYEVLLFAELETALQGTTIILEADATTSRLIQDLPLLQRAVRCEITAEHIGQVVARHTLDNATELFPATPLYIKPPAVTVAPR